MRIWSILLLVLRDWVSRHVPCWVMGHRWVAVSKGRVGLCRKCNGFFRLGKGGRAIERIDDAHPVSRNVRRQMQKGLVSNERKRELRKAHAEAERLRGDAGNVVAEDTEDSGRPERHGRREGGSEAGGPEAAAPDAGRGELRAGGDADGGSDGPARASEHPALHNGEGAAGILEDAGLAGSD